MPPFLSTSEILSCVQAHIDVFIYISHMCIYRVENVEMEKLSFILASYSGQYEMIKLRWRVRWVMLFSLHALWRSLFTACIPCKCAMCTCFSGKHFICPRASPTNDSLLPTKANYSINFKQDFPNWKFVWRSLPETVHLIRFFWWSSPKFMELSPNFVIKIKTKRKKCFVKLTGFRTPTALLSVQM